MILRPTRSPSSRAPSSSGRSPWAVLLLVTTVGAMGAVGCSASAKVEAKTGDDGDEGWERTTETSAPERPRIRAVSSRPATATYPGFRVLDEDKRTSIVLVEVSRDVDVKEQKAEGRLVYMLAGTTVSEKTNRLPLVATAFGTAVSRVRLEQAGADAMLVIETRSPVTANHRVVQTDNGIRLEVTLVGSPWGNGATDARGPYQPQPDR